MPEPVAFVTHLRIKAGKLDDVRRISRAVSAQLEAEQPRTLAQLLFADEEGASLSVLYLFADAASMTAHFEGGEQRAAAAAEYVELVSWDIYGRPEPAILEAMRREAAAAGAVVTVQPDYLGGFLRLRAT